MKTTLILNQDVPNLGEEGDVCKVAAGYARNYLFPKGLAMPYVKANIAVIEQRREAIDLRKRTKRDIAQGHCRRLEQEALVMRMRAGSSGRLYGAVTSAMVVEELARIGITTERKQLAIPNSIIKNLGKYTLSLALYEDITAQFTLDVRSIDEKEIEQSAAGVDDADAEGAIAEGSDTSTAQTQSADQSVAEVSAAAEEAGVSNAIEAIEPDQSVAEVSAATAEAGVSNAIEAIEPDQSAIEQSGADEPAKTDVSSGADEEAGADMMAADNAVVDDEPALESQPAPEADD